MRLRVLSRTRSPVAAPPSAPSDVGQRAARSSLCRRPRLDRTNTATDRRRGGRKVLASAFESRGACPARVSYHGVAVDGRRSTCRAERTWRGCGAGQRAVRCSLRRRPRLNRTNTATTWRRGGRKFLASTFGFRGARSLGRVSHHGVAADGPRSTRRAARTRRGCCGTTRGALHPHGVGRSSTAPTPRQVGSTALGR